jgi:hypothetical protein
VNGTNRLEAACFSDDGDQDVHLVFKVNGQVAAQETDSKDPLTAGTVALLAEAYEESTKAIEVEFDNFVVRTTQRNRRDQQPGQKSSPRQASTEPGPPSAPPSTPPQLPSGPGTTETVTDAPDPSATE